MKTSYNRNTRNRKFKNMKKKDTNVTIQDFDQIEIPELSSKNKQMIKETAAKKFKQKEEAKNNFDREILFDQMFKFD